MTRRPLADTDLAALRELAHACDQTYLQWAPRGWTVPDPPPGWADRYFADDAWALAQWAGDKLIATVAFRRQSPVLAHVGMMLVHPTRWRQGIAGSLLGLAEAEMVARGYEREQLWTPEGAPAEAFYQSRGWARDGRREWHPWAGLVMVGYTRALP